MDRKAPRPVTLPEAKARFRAAAREVGVGPWVRRHPWSALALGGLTGFLFGVLSPHQRRQAGSLLLTAATHQLPRRTRQR